MMHVLGRLVLLPVLLIAPIAPAVEPAPPPPKVQEAAMAKDFLRFVDDAAAGGKLETADVTYRNEKGETVCLVSAVHIGERSYYEGLNESFKKYDAVLYEMVKPKDAVLPAPGEAVEEGGEALMGIREMQRMMKDVLKLDFQLDHIDYQAANFVHADLDAETFERLQKERGETFEQLMLRNLMKALTDPDAAGGNPLGEGDPEEQIRALVRTITRPDMERQIKVLVAKHMMEIETDAAGFGDNSVIIGDRNEAAMKVVEETLQGGKKNLALFYGAAHMPDLEKRLGALGFKKVATEWRQAWDLKIRADQPSAIEQLLMDALDVLMEEGFEEEPAAPEPYVGVE